LSASASEPTYLEAPLGSFLELVSAAEPAPAGGSAAAVVVGLAAALCVMAARLSTRQIPDAPELAATAEALRDRAAFLCQADAEAYGEVMSSMRQTREADPEHRGRQIAEALSVATDIPLEIVEIGAKVAGLAARLAESGNPNLLGDAVTAALLAESGARAACGLVLINLEGVKEDERHARVTALVEEAVKSASKASRKIAL